MVSCLKEVGMSEYSDFFVCLSGGLRDKFQLTPRTFQCYCFSSKKEKELQLLFLKLLFLMLVLDTVACHEQLKRKIFCFIFLNFVGGISFLNVKEN